MSVTPVSQQPESSAKRTILRALLLLVVALVVGFIVGALWGWLSPTAQGRYFVGRGFLPLETQPAAFIQSDLLFAGFMLVMGLLFGWQIRRRHWFPDWFGALWAVLIGVAGALLAAKVGPHFGPPKAPDLPDESITEIPIRLTAIGWTLLWPVTSVAYWFIADLVDMWRNAGEDGEDSDGDQSGDDVTTDDPQELP